MEVTVIESGKDSAELHVTNATAAEILRVYLNKQCVKYAVWRKEHPSKPLIFKIETSGTTVKKAIQDAIAAIKKDCDVLVKGLKGK